MGSRETIGDRTRKHGMTNTKLYGVWCGIKDRCNNKNVEHYNRYGGRGISVCEEWRASFETFRDWAYANGYNPSLCGKEQSLDRIDADGDYCPSNCRWISMREQARNRTDTVRIRYNGRDIPAREFTEMFGISDYVFVYRRIKKGHSAEKILHDWEMLHNTPDNYMRADEAAQHYGVCVESITSWVKKGRLRAEKCGNTLFIQKGQTVERQSGRDEMGRFLPGSK